MKNIETAIEAIEAEKKLELEKVNEFDELLIRLKKLQNGEVNSAAGSEDIPSSASNVQSGTDREEFFKGYPSEMKLSDKLLFLATRLNRPFRSVTCLDLIEEKEGIDRRKEYEVRISQQLNYLVKNMTYVGQKYGSNKNTFYFKNDWTTWNDNEFIILPEYEIRTDEFEAAGIPVHKREQFSWNVSPAVKKMIEEKGSRQ